MAHNLNTATERVAVRYAAINNQTTVTCNVTGHEHTVSVCAWCRHACLDHQPLVLLDDADYALVQSHGICLKCKAEQQAAADRMRADSQTRTLDSNGASVQRLVDAGIMHVSADPEQGYAGLSECDAKAEQAHEEMAAELAQARLRNMAADGVMAGEDDGATQEPDEPRELTSAQSTLIKAAGNAVAELMASMATDANPDDRVDAHAYIEELLEALRKLASWYASRNAFSGHWKGQQLERRLDRAVRDAEHWL